jgi:hypothetical protein
MHAGIDQLRKLRGRSLREVHERGRQELGKIGGRLLGVAVGEPSDERFARELAPGVGGDYAARLLARFRGRGAALPSMRERADVARTARDRFPEACEAILERADRAAAGRFDLLGHRDLAFGDPIDWRLEPTSGLRTTLDHWSTIAYLDPAVAGDKKVTWELNRHAHFVTLGQAYALTGEEWYVEAFIAQASAWLDENPPEQGINWASSLELAFRSIAWIWTLHLMADSPRLTPDLVVRLVKSLAAHGRHVESYLSTWFSPNTHLTGEALGLVYLGLALPELRRAEAWRTLGLEILFGEIDRQFRPDGVYFEQASCYHRYSVDFYLHLVALAQANGLAVPELVTERLAEAVDHLVWITRPDGTSPLYGDDDGGRLLALAHGDARDFRQTVAVAAALFGRSDWKLVAGLHVPEVLWLLGNPGLTSYDALEAVPPSRRARAFRDAGLVVSRTGWSQGDAWALVDCGPHGALSYGHAHADALSFELAAAGAVWLVDPGTYTYTGDASARDHFRGTAAHNTVVVDGRSQSEPGAAFGWETVASASASLVSAGDRCDVLEGSHDGYARLPDPVQHTRTLLFVRGSVGDASVYVVVHDRFDTRGEHRYAGRYHFAPGCSARVAGRIVEVAAPNGAELALVPLGDADAVRLEEGWYSAAYGLREPALVACVEREATGVHAMAAVLVPRAVGEPARTVERRPARAAGAYAFSVRTTRHVDEVVLGDGSATVGGERIEAIGLLAWARLDAAGATDALLVRGTRVAVRGAFAVSLSEPLPVLRARVRGTVLGLEADGAHTLTLEAAPSIEWIELAGETFGMSARTRRVRFERVDGRWTAAAADGGD